jgi:hypothetical protein
MRVTSMSIGAYARATPRRGWRLAVRHIHAWRVHATTHLAWRTDTTISSHSAAYRTQYYSYVFLPHVIEHCMLFRTATSIDARGRSRAHAHAPARALPRLTVMPPCRSVASASTPLAHPSTTASDGVCVRRTSCPLPTGRPTLPARYAYT